MPPPPLTAPGRGCIHARREELDTERAKAPQPRRALPGTRHPLSAGAPKLPGAAFKQSGVGDRIQAAWRNACSARPATPSPALEKPVSSLRERRGSREACRWELLQHYCWLLAGPGCARRHPVPARAGCSLLQSSRVLQTPPHEFPWERRVRAAAPGAEPPGPHPLPFPSGEQSEPPTRCSASAPRLGV